MNRPFWQHRQVLLSLLLGLCSIFLTATSISSSSSSSSRTILVLSDGVELTTGKCGLAGTDHQEDILPRLMNVLSEWLRSVSTGQKLDFQLLTPKCEDVQSAVLQLMNAITNQSNNIAGVLTVASWSTAQGIANVMKSLDLPLVQMATGNDFTMKSTNENHFIISHYMHTHLSILLDTVGQLNWTALSLDSGHSLDRKHLHILLDEAISRNICVQPDTQNLATPRVLIHPYTSSKPTPEFGCFQNILYMGPAVEESVVYPACSSSSSNNNNNNNNNNIRSILGVRFRDESWSNFCQTFLRSSFKNDARYKKISDRCKSGIDSLTSASLSSQDVVMNLGNVITALSFLLQRSNVSYSAGSCQNSHVTSYSCAVFNESRYEMDTTTRVFTGKQIIRPSFYLTEIKGKGTTGKKLMSLAGVPSYVRDRKCEQLCDFCYKCYSKKTETPSSGSISLSRDSGDLFVVGLFPLHKSSTFGECDVANPIGLAQAVTFLHAVNDMSAESSSSRSNQHFIGRNIRGAVVDNCDSSFRTSSLLNSIHFCTYSWAVSGRDNETTMMIQPDSVLGYFTTNSHDADVKRTGIQRIVSISKSGFSSSKDVIMVFAQRLLDVLMRLEWTVLNIILSPQSPFHTIHQYLITLPLSHKFCFVKEILFRTDKENGDDLDLVSSMRSAIGKSSVFLLLTTEEDTLRLFNEISDNEFEDKIQFIFTPWNEKLQETAVVRSHTDVNLILKPLIETEDLSALRTMKTSAVDFSTFSLPGTMEPDLVDFDLIMSQNQIDLSLVQSAVRKFFTKFEDVQKEASWSSDLPDIHVDSSGLVVLAEDVESRLKKTIAEIGDYYQPKEFFTSSPHSQCQGWCPECHVCEKMPETTQTYFHKPGDVIITGLLPLHEEGSQAFQCGRVQDNRADSLHVFVFMFAIETFHFRYPEIPGNLTIGGLVLDSCSNALTAARAVSDFETCRESFAHGDAQSPRKFAENTASSNASSQTPSAYQNLVYVVIDEALNAPQLKSVLSGSDFGDFLFMQDELIEQRYVARAILDLIAQLGWTHAFLLSEDSPYYHSIAQEIISKSSSSNVCVVSHMVFETRNEWRVERSLDGFEYFPVVLISRRSTAYSLFDWIGELAKSYFWIISAITADWIDYDPNTIPLGSIILTSPPMENEDLRSWLQEPLHESLTSDWLREYWEYRYSCRFKKDDDVTNDDAITLCPLDSTVGGETPLLTTPVTSQIIRSVDAIFHKVQERHLEACRGKSKVCPELLDDIVQKTLPSRDVSFYYQGEKMEVDASGQVTVTLSVFNLKPNGVVKVGHFFKSSLNLTRENVTFFYPNGSLYHVTHVQCRHRCSCVISANVTNQATELLPSHSYREYRGEFLGDLWAIIVSSIAAAGALAATCLICYVLYKVCKRAIGKRFVGLGLLLLISLLLLYISILPFVLSAHNVVCGLRYLFHGVAFALVFAGILVKLMTIQSYKIIGLGGEISSANQFITVFFIVGVQVAISAQWWVYNAPMVITKLDALGVVKYACHFDRASFAYFHSYLAALLLICSVYSVAVRKEKRNMGEARLLMISCWICVFLWIAWAICFFVLDREFSDLVTCAAILSCATAVILVLFVPKMKMVAGLKYSISHKDPIKNGYTIDTDFLYERPFSLPGTLTSTFSTAKITPPKPLSHFNSDVNY